MMDKRQSPFHPPLEPVLTHIVGTSSLSSDSSWFQQASTAFRRWMMTSWMARDKETETTTTTTDDKVTLVCISDTHGQHRQLDMPPGDILLHAGDYTLYGRREDAEDFNAWLGTLSYQHILVIQGNHEANAPWKKEAKAMLSNAKLLVQEGVTLTVAGKNGASVHRIKFFGLMFNWPCRGENPYFEQIPTDTDIVLSHCPARGCVDMGKGCASLRTCMLEKVKPRLVVSGHEHKERGVTVVGGTTFVNAANAAFGNHQVTKQPIVLYY